MKKKKRGSSRYFFLFFFLSVLIVILFATVKKVLGSITYFETKQIEIIDTVNLEKSYLLNLSKDFSGRNLFSISEAEVLAKYDNIIRIKGVSVRKRIPHTLQIEIQERTGVFLIKTKEGLIFPIDNERIVLDNDVFYKTEAMLPVICTDILTDSIFYGEPIVDAFVEKIYAFVQKVKEIDANFITKISEFYQYDDELYVVEADKGYRILFAEDEIEDQLARFHFIENNRRFAQNNIVDLRFEDQLIIRKVNQ